MMHNVPKIVIESTLLHRIYIEIRYFPKLSTTGDNKCVLFYIANQATTISLSTKSRTTATSKDSSTSTNQGIQTRTTNFTGNK